MTHPFYLRRSDIVAMRKLACQGLSVEQIAVQVGRSKASVRRHAGDILKETRVHGTQQISPRSRRVLEAYDALAGEDRSLLVVRFGLKNLNSLKVRACQIRKSIRQQEETEKCMASSSPSIGSPTSATARRTPPRTAWSTTQMSAP